MDPKVKCEKAKPQMQITEISGGACGLLYRRGETSGILRCNEVNNEIQLEAINISPELGIKNKEDHEDQEVRDTVPLEYLHLLHLFEKGEKTTGELHRPAIGLEIDLNVGKLELPKKI